MLIDADNAQPSIADGMLAEVAKYGTAHVKRAYGDWTSQNLRGWKDQLLAQSIQPIQQFGYTTGKNATDSAMIIDAMDLLYTGNLDGFVIVSSDSDFTRLASRIRESGLTVYGFGQRKTPQPFVAACDKFIYAENLTVTAEEPPANNTRKPTNNQLKGDAKLMNLLRNAVDAASDDSGWATLATVGSIINKQRTDFDPRSYGYGKLGELFAATTLFDLQTRSPGEGKQQVVYVRDIRARSEGP
ncbi:NYN domain-containing protein [Nocardia callitridis]|uniref:NYN domain-containing protein n=1 Tax=Nocardia callitridis TaxID=648753 RepID=A0ABP9KT34_9NOCA